MTTINEPNLVRIVWTGNEPRPFSGTAGVERAPRVGDIGAVVHTYSSTTFAVECVDAQGMTVWLADFHLGELESVEPPAGSKPPDIDIEMRFLPIEQGGREHLPDLGGPGYRPHLRVPPSTEMLGVQFDPGPYGQIRHDEMISASVRPLYDSTVPYEQLRPGVSIEVVEGSRVVARGSVTRIR